MALTCLSSNKKLGGYDQTQPSFHFWQEPWSLTDPLLNHTSNLYYPWGPIEVIQAL